MQTRVMDTQTRDYVEEAVAVWQQGELVVLPTDTVYGVAALPSDPEAIAKLYAAKQRPLNKAIPLLLAKAQDVQAVAQDIPDVFWPLANRFWPGGLTLILPRAPHLPDILCAGGPTVAVRVPDHPIALELIAAAGGALATTSANRSGEPPALDAVEAKRALAEKVALVVDGGQVPGGVASTVLDLTQSPPRILRKGPISETMLKQVWEEKR